MQNLGMQISGLPVIPRPAAGGLLVPWQVLTATTATPTSGTVTFISIDVNNLPVKGIAANCSTAGSGGSYTVTLACYKDNGRGTGPDISSGPILSGTIATATTGSRVATATQTTLNGKYWLAFLYYVTTTPTTAPQFSTVANNVMNTNGLVSTWTMSNVLRGFTLAGQTDMPTSGTPAGSASTNIVLLGLQSAA